MHLASGDIPVVRSMLSDGEQGVDETVQLMVNMAKGQYGAKSAKIRALAVNILNAAGVGDKDYYGYAKAIHEWVRDQIRYIKDPVGQETLSHPEELAFNTKAGDCDDKSILEMALLGSIGIRSYPVVVGVKPGRFSHVYVYIQIPEGGRPGRFAGETIAADPIMREWSLGQEAPPHKISAKKTYEHLAGLDPMLDGYASGPAYLDEEDVSSVKPALRARLVDTAGRGEILNAPKIDERNTDELDDMFGNNQVTVFRQAPSWELHSLGPVTGAEAAGSVRRIPARTYETAQGKKSFTPAMRRILPRVADAPSALQIDPGVVVQASADLADIGVYIDSLMGEVLGADVPAKVAATAAVAKQRIKRAQRVMRAGFLPGMGDELADHLGAAVVRTAAKAQRLLRAAGGTRQRRVQLNRALRGAAAVEQAGVTAQLDANRIPAHQQVRVIQGALYQVIKRVPQTAIHDEPPVRPLRSPVLTPLAAGSRVSVRGQADQLMGVDGFFSSVASSVKKTVHKVVPKPIRKVATKVAGVTTGGFITAGATSLLGKSGKKSAYAFAKEVTGSKKWGDRYIRAGRATLAAGAAVAGGAMLGIGAASAPAGALTTPSSLAAATSLNGAVVSTSATGVAGFTSVTFASGASAIVPSGMVAAMATGSAATVASAAAAAASAGTITAVTGGALVAGAGALAIGAGAKAMKGMMKPAAAGGDQLQYTDENGNPISKEQYDALMARYRAESQSSATPIPTEPPMSVPNMVDLAPGGDQFNQAPADYYGPADTSDPYASAYGDSSAGAAPPIDSFGPQDMGPAVTMESATAEDSYGDPSGGGQSFTRELTASGDEYPQEEASEGPRRTRAAPEPEYFEPEYVDEGDEPMAFEDEDAPEGPATDLDADTDRPARDLDGMGDIALPSLTTLALIGLGAYLLLKKRA